MWEELGREKGGGNKVHVVTRRVLGGVVTLAGLQNKN